MRRRLISVREALQSTHKGREEGTTTNDEFEAVYPDGAQTHDLAIRALESMVWNFFGDFSIWPFASREAFESASKANASPGIVMP